MRQQGWEARLVEIVEAARHRPYVLGDHDCFRVACQVVEALTGRDLWAKYGGYTTKREALKRIAEYGSTFEAAFSTELGPPWDVKHARRGDVVCIQTEDEEKHLGVCLGWQSAFLAPTGLLFVPTLSCLCAWRIG